jgi:histidyl-tRNA synthetase
MNKKSFLGSSPYKGTRDFYPLTSIINSSNSISYKHHQNYFFETIRSCLILNGFCEYSSSLIEEKGAFTIKSGEELASNQLYYFTDKGDREIALRPELTLSIARMVADKFDNLRLPLRWFSIDNCFRYERPQKGRLREFWQVEVDIIGAKAGAVDFEIIRLILEIFQAFKAKPNMYKIMYNHRLVLDKWLSNNGWIEELEIKNLIYKVLDDWFKLENAEKEQKLLTKLDQKSVDKIFKTVDNNQSLEFKEYQEIANQYEEMILLQKLIPKLYPDANVIFTPAIIRGQAYYTGLIFEAFDNNPTNSRSLFGGGRFDDLLDLYGKSSPAVGFAPGDVSVHEFLAGWELYPKQPSEIQVVGIMPNSKEELENVFTTIIPDLQLQNKAFEIDYDYDRNPNKRYENLKKRGCTEILKS